MDDLAVLPPTDGDRTGPSRQEHDAGGLGVAAEHAYDLLHQIRDLDGLKVGLLDRAREIELLAEDRSDRLGLGEHAFVGLTGRFAVSL